MQPEELANNIDTIITRFVQGFEAQISLTQKALHSQLLLLVKQLELDDNGYILQNAFNRNLVAKLNATLDKAFSNSGYYEKLNETPRVLENLTEETVKYFNHIGVALTVNTRYLKSLQAETINQIQSLMMNEGLEVAVNIPIRNILNQNISTGAFYKDLVEQLRTYNLGNATLKGKLQQYAGQIVTDTLFNYARGMQTAVSASAGLMFVIYLGGVVKDSRDFCVGRAGKYYHKKEVEEWANQEWAGKRAGTTASTIFIFAGGYRCQHQIIFVSEFTVPKEVIERAKNL